MKSLHKEHSSKLPIKIRVSQGTAITIGLQKGRLDAEPTTAYLMTYQRNKCSANCGFCPQAKSSTSNTELLSRVTWPTFPTFEVLSALAYGSKEKKFERICIQALNYPEAIEDIESLVKEIKKHCNNPISVSYQPQTKENIHRLYIAGINRLAISLDLATPELFQKIKGVESNYKWENIFHQLRLALDLLGKGNVSTHLIIGLGETEKEAAHIVQKCVDMGVLPALFAFTPIRGTALQDKPQPKIEAYRRVQLARYLIVEGKSRIEDMHFNEKEEITNFGIEQDILKILISNGLPFRTSGCPYCNRPFYNERPSGPIYNFPKELTEKEIANIKKELS